jgi:hypothetical protein
MPTILSEPEYESPELGFHQARLIKLEDLGMRANKFDPTKPKHELKLRFELLNEKNSRGEPLIHHVWVTFTLHQDSNARKVAVALLNGAPVPKHLDFDTLIGKTCTIEVLAPEPGKKRSKNRFSFPAELWAQPAVPATKAPAFEPSWTGTNCACGKPQYTVSPTSATCEAGHQAPLVAAPLPPSPAPPRNAGNGQATVAPPEPRQTVGESFDLPPTERF